MSFAVRIAAACAVLLGASAAQAGPTSTLYLTYTGLAGYSGIGVVQGNTTSAFPSAYPAGGYAIPIAVSGDVRTTGFLPVMGSGGQYTLAGAATGTSYANPGFEAYDGTTDGTRNYVVDYGNGNVLATDRDFSNPVVLFNVGAGKLGITYDRTNNSLWISQWYGGDSVSNYTLGGTLLSSFQTGYQGIGALALDEADQTLWLVDDGASGTLQQYSKAGVLLGTGPNVGYSLGGEFNISAGTVPEPGSMLLVGMAVLALAGQRRRQAKR